MPIIQKISTASIGGRFIAAGREQPTQGRQRTAMLPVGGERLALSANRELRRVMTAAGITQLGDVDKLSETQLARMLENKTPLERITVKQLVIAFGLWPCTRGPF